MANKNKKKQPSGLDKRIGELRAEFNEQKTEQLQQAVDYTPQIKKDESDTRLALSKRIVGWYFILFSVLIIGVPLYNLFADDAVRLNFNEVIQAYSAVVGPVVGFVVAYLFKTRD